MDILEALKALSLPDPLVMNDGRRVKTRDDLLLRREEIKELLANEMYGKMPPPSDHLDVKVEEIDNSFAAGKASVYTLRFNATFEDEIYSFRVKSVIPSGMGRMPAIIYLSDTADIPNKYLPAEEIADRGYAVFLLPVNEITRHGKGARFHDGLARSLSPRRRSDTSPGKLMMWAWGAMRVMDYVKNQTSIRGDRTAVCAHGTLGISALIAGGFDERFEYVISNCAGTLGTSISRGKLGDTPESLIESYPTFFSRKFTKSKRPLEKAPYDQHFLLFLSLDRHLLIGSAELDLKGDARGELLALAALEESASLFSEKPVCPITQMPRTGEALTLGGAFYRLRSGGSYFSRDDWNTYLDYIDKNL